MKYGYVFGGFVTLIVLGFLSALLTFPTTICSNTIQTPVGINNRVMNADNALYTYEWFKQQEADIERLYVQEQNHKDAFDLLVNGLPDNKSEWSYWDKEEYQRLSSNLTAQKDMVNKAIHDYNAKSNMASKNIFKDNLPSNLSRSFYAQSQLLNQ